MFRLKRKTKKRLIKFSLYFGIFLVVLAGVALSPIGNQIVKMYLKTEVQKYLPGAKITYLDYSFKNFSLILSKGNNVIKLYGDLFPFNAMLEADIKNLSDFEKNLKGALSVNGRIDYNNHKLIINGLANFAEGLLNFNTFIGKKVFFSGKGDGFDIQKLLYMINVNYPYVTGVTSLKIEKNAQTHLYMKTKGKFRHIVSFSFKADTDMNIKNRKNFGFISNVDTDMGNMKINGDVKSGILKNRFDIKNLKISKLQTFLLYPVIGDVNLSGTYDGKDRILKFESKTFEGFWQPGRIEITFQMKDKTLFDYLGLPYVLKGNITGNIKIRKKTGNFDVVNNQTKIVKNSVTKKIFYLTGVDLTKEKIGNIFIKGAFNMQKMNFSLLSTSPNLSFSIKNGVLVYPEKIEFIMYLRKDNNIYKLKVYNGSVKLLEKKEYRPADNKILVF